jgi:histidyl-tRNA synthetase
LLVGIDDEGKKLILREIDKLDKIGVEKVRQSLTTLGVNTILINQLLGLITFNGSNQEVLLKLENQNIDEKNEIYHQGLQEIKQVVEALKGLGVPDHRTRINLAIARGLDYYTGTVYETLIDAHPEFGSVCSGGRYDDLASHYTRSKLPGVGISIGLTRLFDQLNAHGLLPPAPPTVQILVAQVDSSFRADYLTLATELRHAGYTVENYLEPAKLDKQLKYADKSGIPVVVLMGPDEREKGTVQIKNMAAKSQTELPRAAVLTALRETLKC